MKYVRVINMQILKNVRWMLSAMNVLIMSNT